MIPMMRGVVWLSSVVVSDGGAVGGRGRDAE